MKLNLKKIGVEAEADVEKIIEKGMDNHEKDWKDKLLTKKDAKKEMAELKHSQKVEMEELKQKRKGFLAEKIRKEKQERRNVILAVIFVIIIIIFCIVMGALGIE